MLRVSRESNRSLPCCMVTGKCLNTYIVLLLFHHAKRTLNINRDGQNKEEEVEITMNGIYRGEDFVAAGVLLTNTQMGLYEVPGSVPLCSLSKAPGRQCKDVGICMKKVMEATDWMAWEGKNSIRLIQQLSLPHTGLLQ